MSRNSYSFDQDGLLKNAVTIFYWFAESSTKLNVIKASDFIALKTMKNASTALKLTLIAACVITDQIVVDPYSEASAKKVVRISTIFKQVQPDVS